MKYVVTGAAGKISRPLVKQLLQAGHSVTVIGRNEKNLEPLIYAGARAAIGSIYDLSFLKLAFAGADAVYTMYPTDIFVDDLKTDHEWIGKNYAAAIADNSIQYVVNLSSIGAHLAKGAGPVSGLHYTEQALYTLKAVNILTLRAAYFYQNLLMSMELVRHMNMIGGVFSFENGQFPVSHPDDVAAVAAAALLDLNFSGHSLRYVASDETGTDEIASVLGETVGKPGLQWTKFDPAHVLDRLQHVGFSPAMAGEYVDMFVAMERGLVTEDYWKNRPASLGKIKLDDFAKQYAAIYYQEPTTITE